jgi:2-oxoglutarate dehydrogenase E2 component (dihydrolipoamide succinyltransferase)
MPQIGEGISEATIIAWKKAPGDSVLEGETLLEISTAKVDVELPAPANGVLREICHPAEATVPVDTIIAYLAPPGSVVSVPAESPQSTAEPASGPAAPISRSGGFKPARPVTVPPGGAATPSSGPLRDLEQERRLLLRRHSTPLVRRLARDLGIDLSQVPGTGIHGRVTRRDLELYMERKKSAREKRHTAREDFCVAGTCAEQCQQTATSADIPEANGEEQTKPMSTMRKQIAEHMARSYRRSPHAFTVFEMDFTRIEQFRLKHREEFENRFGVKLTSLVFLLKALAEVLPRFPILTAHIREEQIVYPPNVNLGVAVAIPDGLLVPVIHEVEDKTLGDLAQLLQDKATRARQGKLVLTDVEGGTFTVTSPGQLGCLMGIPIINQPQSAILHIGAITKTPSVLTSADGQDVLAIRQKAIFTLGFDHRLIDGWDADSFMAALRERLEHGEYDIAF